MQKIDKAEELGSVLWRNDLLLAKSTKSHKYKHVIFATARDPFHRFNYDERERSIPARYRKRQAASSVDDGAGQRKSVGVHDVYQDEHSSHCKAGQRIICTWYRRRGSFRNATERLIRIYSFV